MGHEESSGGDGNVYLDNGNIFTGVYICQNIE